MASDEPYALDPRFERAAVTLACRSPRFYGRVARELNPKLLGDPRATTAMEACHALAREIGHGPGGTMLVIQRLRAWVHDGRLTLAQVGDVADLFTEAEDAGLPPEDDVVAVLAPVLVRRRQHDVVKRAMSEYANRGDFSAVVTAIHDANRIGVVDTSVGTRLGPASFREIEKLKTLVRLGTGIPELDLQIGGLPRGQYGLFIAASGGGKSMSLSHMCAAAVVSGFFCVYATLELPKEIIQARLMANLTGIPINAIIDDTTAAAAKLAAFPTMGACYVHAFTPTVTTVPDLRAWFAQCAEQEGRKPDAVFIDYADKVGAPDEDNDYRAGKVVAEGLRVWADEDKLWLMSASQPQRRKDKRQKRIEQDDVADSMHKIRSANLVITANPEDEEALQLKWFVAKHSTGKSNFTVGPLPTAWDLGRVAPVTHDATGPL